MGAMDPWLADRYAGVETRAQKPARRAPAPPETRRARRGADAVLHEVGSRARRRRRARFALWLSALSGAACVAYWLLTSVSA